MSDRTTSHISKWWRKASLIQRLVLVALLPSAVSTVFLAVLLTRDQINSMRKMIHSTASAYVAQAASEAAGPLHQRNLPELRRMARSIGRMPHVSRVLILDSTGSVLAESRTKVTHDSPQVHVRQPIHDRRSPDAVIGAMLVDIDTESTLLAQHTSIFDTLVWLGIAILLAILLSWQQARWISAPLRRLSVAIRGLGRVDHPLSVEVSDESEIGDLQRGFNTAASTLHTLHRDMERRIEGATQELARKNAALEQASKAKARFLASATHDLRQPLYALTLFSSALAEKETNPERLDRIAHVQQCIESLDRLFSELLDLSRLEAGAMQPEMRDFPLDELFQEVSRNFRIQAEKQELRLITRPTNVWVHTDRTMLARILNNLVSNALRYTHEGGVLVGARQRGNHIRIDVRDTGVGIPEEHRAHIFEEFYRVDDPSGKSREHTGTRGGQRGLGLGLSTVKRLSELLDAECTLHSTPGHGSLFTLMIPASRMTESARTQTERSVRRIAAPSHDLEGISVMVIDDDQAILAGMHDLLSKWGCRVYMAESCKSAMERAAHIDEPPDLVITDLHLGGGCDGVQAMRDLAVHYGSTPDKPPFARLLITGETERKRLQEAVASHIPILFKPVPAEPLREAIITLLRKRRNLQEVDSES